VRVRAGAAGFTLVELTVVVAVLASVAVLALPSIRRGTEGLQLRSAAGRVAALFREARVQAVTQRRPTRVSLAGSGHAVQLAWGDGEPLRQVELPSRIRLDPAGGAETLTFSPRGVARDLRWIVEGSGGRRVAVEVHGITGRVTVAPAAT
jgi:prepilin-type N-terminal cleavage/methylation domain-containing protein